MTNTNWQYYAARRRCRTSRRWPGWRCRTSSPPASASRSLVALHPRARLALGRRSSATSTSTSPARCSTSCCRSRSSAALVPRLPGRAPDPRRATVDVTTLDRRSTQTLALGPGRLAGGDQGARDQRRRLLQRQLGDAVREPDVAHELRRAAADPRRSRPALTATYGRMVGNRRQGWAIYAAMMVLFVVARRDRLRRRGARDARDARRRRRRRQHRGQGAALRHRLHRAVRRRHDGRLVRRGQRRDGVAHRPRRRRPDGEHA